MKPDERNIEEVLQHSLPSAQREQMEVALDRVFARLRSDRGGLVGRATPRKDGAGGRRVGAGLPRGCLDCLSNDE